MTAGATIDPAPIADRKIRNASISRSDIEQIASRLHKQLWRTRSALLPANRQDDPVELLDPELVLRSIGFSVALLDSLGTGLDASGQYEVAGLIDRPSRSVSLSRQLQLSSRRFTAAHELGHALLHTNAVHHRDRAIDGPSSRARDRQEMEADRFASDFLMPRKLVQDEFVARFGSVSFALDESSAIHLGFSSSRTARGRLRSSRDISRHLAGAKTFHSRAFYSMAERFRVSVETMAIRIEELGLILY
jgi:Zn-dependent peptidase ImmA (M78 family)